MIVANTNNQSTPQHSAHNQSTVNVFHSSQFQTRDTNNWTLLASHCRYLISTLNKKTYRGNVAEITQLESLYEADVVGIIVLKCLVNQIDWKDMKRQKDQYRIQFLSQRVAQITTQANFSSLICQAFDDTTVHSLPEGFLSNFAKTLKLTIGQQATIALGLCHSRNSTLKSMASTFLLETLPNLQIKPDSLPSERCTDHVIHELLFWVQTTDAISCREKESLVEVLKKCVGANMTFVPIISVSPERSDVKRNTKKEVKLLRQAPFLQDLDKSFSPAELMADLGFVCCATAGNLKKALGVFSSLLSSSSIAEVIGMMANWKKERKSDQILLYNELDSMEFVSSEFWNVEVFAGVLREMVFPVINPDTSFPYRIILSTFMFSTP
eukprot:TRINITY_DN15209_c0_g1_i1.p1 TRINITY_DN15209_c0_g1~~TRINITY_DN15209_c0_g1_i1.p1  ORF type:complete len:382 (+),score=56.78 TRINITY_DN15209_c0_g1_i1:62-1207(+)